MDKKKLEEQQDKELKEINDEFHGIIKHKKHCYDREKPEERCQCECEYYYNKWIETKAKYQKLMASTKRKDD